MQLDWPANNRHGRPLGGSAQHKNELASDDNCNEMDDLDADCDCELCQMVDGQNGGGGHVGGFINVGELSGSRFDLK